MKQVPVDGATLNVFDRGTGHPIVFVHGFPLNHTMWSGQLDPLADSYRVIAPDLRGFGQSTVTDGTVSMDQFADDLNALLDALDVSEPITLCGLSMGGYIAWSFVRKYADRLHSLILCDTRAAADTEEAVRTRKKLADSVLQLGSQTAANAMQSKLFAPSTNERRPEIVASVRAMIATTDPRGIAAALLGMAERLDSTGLLSEIEVPALLVVGSEDILSTPTEMREMAESIGNSRFVEILDAGHMSPLEQPDAVNAAIRSFLGDS